MRRSGIPIQASYAEDKNEEVFVRWQESMLQQNELVQARNRLTVQAPHASSPKERVHGKRRTSQTQGTYGGR